MGPMNILAVHNRYQQPGGEDAVFAAETELLANHGCNVHTVSEAPSDPNGIIEKIDVAVSCVWSKSSYDKYRNILAEEQPDVVHVHNFFPVISPAIYYACRDAQVPVVQTLHNYRIVCPAATFYRDGRICEECLEHGPWR